MKHTSRYLKGTRDKGIIMRPIKKLQNHCYVDILIMDNKDKFALKKVQKWLKNKLCMNATWINVLNDIANRILAA